MRLTATKLAIGLAAVIGAIYMLKRTPPDTLRGLIEQLNRDYFGGRLDPRMVEAIVKIESSGQDWAVRYEAKIDDASVGLMQILTGTAKWLGFSGSWWELFEPRTNLLYGMKMLDWLGERLTTTEAIVQAYNVGLAGYQQGRRNSTYLSRYRAAYAGLG